MIKLKKFLKWVTEAVKKIGDGAAYCFNLYEDKKAWTTATSTMDLTSGIY